MTNLIVNIATTFINNITKENIYFIIDSDIVIEESILKAVDQDEKATGNRQLYRLNAKSSSVFDFRGGSLSFKPANSSNESGESSHRLVE